MKDGMITDWDMFEQVILPTCGMAISHHKLALFDISISNIDCRYIDTFEKYQYRYQYRYGHFENIDIDKAILENIDI